MAIAGLKAVKRSECVSFELRPMISCQVMWALQHGTAETDMTARTTKIRQEPQQRLVIIT